MAGIPLSQEDFIKRCAISLPNFYNYDFSKAFYINSRTNVIISCNTHGQFISNPINLINGKGCKICDRMSGNNARAKLTIDQYKIVASNLHNNKYDYSLISDSFGEKIEIICPPHGKFLIRKSAHISPRQLYGCQKCGNNRSIGEEKIANYLESHNIQYEYQKTFDWAWSIGRKQPLRYDFYIPKLNILIEFDGRHHFEPTRYGGQTLESSIFQTKRTKFYDGIKTANAILNGIQIIRISYEKLKDIDRILDKELLNRNE